MAVPLLCLLVAPLFSLIAQSTPTPASTLTGDLRLHEITSKIFNNTRKIRVLLPPGYDDPENKARRYPVLYLNDGQNLFDVATSLFNPMEWRVDETVADLIRRGAIKPLIVVGIDNAGRRMRFNEYFPYADEFLQPPMPSPQGKKYPDFVANEVMPLVDRLYRTKPGRANTAIGGSSAGAIAALQAVIAKPNVFGLLLMESPSLYISNQQMLHDSKGIHPLKAYMGVGTNEMGEADCRTGDTGGEAVQDVLKLKDVLLESGMKRSDLKVVVEDCAIHNEEVWARRLPTAIEFLFGRTGK